MNKGEKHITWFSNYKESLGDFLAHSLTEHEKQVFHMLWVGYAIPMKLKSSYFELLRVGDGKYTLTVQQYANGRHSIKFSVRNNYANASGRFTT